jgi:hypothetical protein
VFEKLYLAREPFFFWRWICRFDPDTQDQDDLKSKQQQSWWSEERFNHRFGSRTEAKGGSRSTERTAAELYVPTKFAFTKMLPWCLKFLSNHGRYTQILYVSFTDTNERKIMCVRPRAWTDFAAHEHEACAARRRAIHILVSLGSPKHIRGCLAWTNHDSFYVHTNPYIYTHFDKGMYSPI